MIVEIECLPEPRGTDASPYAYVEAAIAVIQGSGLNSSVGALGTTFEGPPERVWPLVREAHEACLKAGATKLVTIVKMIESEGEGPTMGSLTARYAPR